MDRKTHSIYRARYCPHFEIPTGVLGAYPPQIRGGLLYESCQRNMGDGSNERHSLSLCVCVCLAQSSTEANGSSETPWTVRPS